MHMIKNKVSIERQFDERIYQFLISQEGNWNEVISFAQDIIEYGKKQIEIASKKEEVMEEIKIE